MRVYVGKIYVDPLEDPDDNKAYTVCTFAEDYQDAVKKIYADYGDDVTKFVLEEVWIENDGQVISNPIEWDEILELKEKYDNFSF